MANSERESQLQELIILKRRLGDTEGAAQAQVQLNRERKGLESAPKPNPNPLQHVPMGGYAGGLVTMGAGFDRLVTGARELGMMGANALVPPAGGPQNLENLRGDYARRREVYDPLAEQLGGSATLGEMVGETAPFVGLPVPTILRGGASLFENPGIMGKVTDSVARLMPEFVAGGAESAIPIDEQGRVSRFAEDGATAALGGRLVDKMSQRANARRGKFTDPNVSEMFQLGEEAGVPIRSGSLKDQLAAADDFAAGKTTSRMPGEIGEDIIAGAQEGVAKVKRDFKDQYSQLWGALDQYGADVSALRPTLGAMLATEKARGSHASKPLMNELKRWIETPDEGLTVEKLHEFRTALKGRINALDPAEISRKDSWLQLEKEVTDQIYSTADAISPQLAGTLKNLDTWYYEDLGKLQRAPGVKAALGENPSPVQVANWFTSNPTPFKKQLFNSLTDTGKDAVLESVWNNAYRAGSKGKEFNPLNYARYVEDHAESAKGYMTPQDYKAFLNTGKLMRYIASEGKTADFHLSDMIRGYPFYHKKAVEGFRKANWRWKMSQAPEDIRPDSPEMETFYRGVLRSLMIQDASELGEGYGSLLGREEQEVQPPLRRGY